MLTGKKRGGKEKKQTPKMDQNRMNTAVRKRHVFRCFSSDPRNGGASGHALNTEPRPIGKGCAQRHPGSDHSHTRYREMTVARGVRAFTAQPKSVVIISACRRVIHSRLLQPQLQHYEMRCRGSALTAIKPSESQMLNYAMLNSRSQLRALPLLI